MYRKPRGGRVGGVEPDVDTCHEPFGHNHIVVLEEDDLAGELRHFGNFGDTPDQTLSGPVGRVCLSGEYELHGGTARY